MQVYFSHSYRDVPINTYFSRLFDTAGISLRADQKTDVWCMAKLERYLFEFDGFVSIIPRRVDPNESLTYSPYIGREMMLARRARTPRILFVDDQVLNQYRSAFPTTAVPFFHEAPELELTRHTEEISRFRRILAGGAARPPRKYVHREARVIAGEGPLLRDGASHVAAILRSERYSTQVLNACSDLDEAFDDIDVFESLLDAELLVFVLDNSLSYPDVLLAMAHAHCIPSVRLRHDPNAKSSDPELSGVVRWSSLGKLASAFGELFQNYQSAFANPLGEDDLQHLAVPVQASRDLNTWNTADGPGLVVHVRPQDTYVTGIANAVTGSLAATEPGRVQADMICRGIYERVKRDHFYYTFEPVLAQAHGQRIRPPMEIDALNCGTCIDFACLFAAMLEAAHERPVIIVVATRWGAHALTAYVAPDAILVESLSSLGDLRGAVIRGELVAFETTGAVEARGRTVGAETEIERKEGGDMLDYRTAKLVAKRLLLDNETRLIHCVNVRDIRSKPIPSE